MSVQELKKQQDDYGNSHQIISFDGRAPKNLTLEMGWKLAPLDFCTVRKFKKVKHQKQKMMKSSSEKRRENSKQHQQHMRYSA